MKYILAIMIIIIIITIIIIIINNNNRNYNDVIGNIIPNINQINIIDNVDIDQYNLLINNNKKFYPIL